MWSSRSNMRSSSRRSTKLGMLRNTSSFPPWKSTINWMFPNTEGHLPSAWTSLIGSELPIDMIFNMRLLSTQLLQPEAWEVEGTRDQFGDTRSPTMAQAGYQFGEGTTSPRETWGYRGLRDVPTNIPWKQVRWVQGKITCSWSNLPTSKRRWEFTKKKLPKRAQQSQP